MEIAMMRNAIQAPSAILGENPPALWVLVETRL